jgi:hypothetical protein
MVFTKLLHEHNFGYVCLITRETRSFVVKTFQTMKKQQKIVVGRFVNTTPCW